MKQVVYTCTRCGKQETVAADRDYVPLEWATIQYVRDHAGQEGDKPMVMRTTCLTHACGACAQGVLDYIERKAS